jgi:hypothetical protein
VTKYSGDEGAPVRPANALANAYRGEVTGYTGVPDVDIGNLSREVLASGRADGNVVVACRQARQSEPTDCDVVDAARSAT